MTRNISLLLRRALTPFGLAILVATVQTGLAHAAPMAIQPIENTASICAAQIARQEQAHRIPSQLLAAVSLAESGRWSKESSAISAWPWTVMAEGKGQFFSSKAEAIAHVKALRARGVRNIDVGCMQVNLMHHPDAFADLEEALDPESNVAYAAGFLKRLFDGSRSWITAVGNYHSATPEHHVRYRNKIVTLWNDTRRRAAEAKRQETVAAYRERRAAYFAKRGEPMPAPQTVASTPNRVAAYTPRFPLAVSAAAAPGAIGFSARGTGPATRPAVPVGQILPRTSAVPFERR